MPPPQPSLPDPAHHDVDSMLSRKFGREVANYFSGSPLNRVSFLRANHDFIAKALIHPTTSFLLFNDLAPLAKDPTQLAYASHSDVKPLIGENPFEKTEEELIKEFNSTITQPLVLFLGLDERKKEGFEHGIYKGKPYFAVDVTPKGTVHKEASVIVESLKSKGLQFVEGRMHMTLNAPEGKRPPLFLSARIILTATSCNLCPSSRVTRLECSQPLLRRMRPTHNVRQRRNKTRVPSNRLRPWSNFSGNEAP
jgi:NAD+ diphosphatase